MSRFHFDKLFSPEEANELIPRLDDLMRRLQLEATRLREKIDALAQRDASVTAMELADILALNPDLRIFAARMADAASEIESLGCLLKDIDQGLVDFPFAAGDDEVALFCWQFGEPQIVAWHSLESGFADRRPLPGARKPYLN
ncbi:MAG: DUF2203 domain-containing protein [Candidatus Binataceae bacterium]